MDIEVLLTKVQKKLFARDGMPVNFCLVKGLKSFFCAQLTEQDKEEWAMEQVSPSLWNDLSRDIQLNLIEREIWRQDVLDEWRREVEEEEVNRRPTAYKQYKRYMKKNPTG